ncbi:hypothetical protein M0R45_010464 [Rubus argutus]|uniref:Protein DA1-like domain-containing protein n=1 Tax=Rubus argutus TaxID=59490 RepID=A0AAW1Y9Q5_RUBAR
MLVLFGKPDVEIGAILAHEMMHVSLLQRLKGCTAGLERSVEEGICEVMAYMWMEWYCFGGFDSSYKTSVQAQYTRALKDYMSKRMKRSKDEIYGQGFRDAMEAVSKFGLIITLDHIVKNRCLPPCAK